MQIHTAILGFVLGLTFGAAATWLGLLQALVLLGWGLAGTLLALGGETVLRLASDPERRRKLVELLANDRVPRPPLNL